jgi:hypothetical protein
MRAKSYIDTSNLHDPLKGRSLKDEQKRLLEILGYPREMIRLGETIEIEKIKVTTIIVAVG